jgi:hypothetical protein
VVRPFAAAQQQRAGGDRGAGEYHDKCLVVDLAQLADGGQKDGEHESEHPRRRRERAHQASPGWR